MGCAKFCTYIAEEGGGVQLNRMKYNEWSQADMKFYFACFNLMKVEI